MFAYGQTSSGKTFTMEGCLDSEEMEGVITRTARLIFTFMKELEEKGWTYKVEASYITTLKMVPVMSEKKIHQLLQTGQHQHATPTTKNVKML